MNAGSDVLIPDIRFSDALHDWYETNFDQNDNRINNPDFLNFLPNVPLI